MPHKILKQIELFPEADSNFLKALFKEDLDAFLDECRIITVSKDTRFITSGDLITRIWILVAGKVNVLEEYRTGMAYIFQENEAPSVFGEMEMIADIDFYMASLIAKTECLMITVPVQKYLDHLKKQPNLLFERAKENLNVLLISGHDNRIYLQLNSIDRIKIYFIKHYETNGLDGICTLRVTHQQIADETGYSIKTVLRCITKLKTQGLLGVLGQAIMITSDQYTRMLNSME